MNKTKPIVVIESPFAGDIEGNCIYARRALLDSLRLGESPFASHLLYTQVLIDEQSAERSLGIAAGLEFHRVADTIAFYCDLGWSKGMLAARKACDKAGRSYEIRYIGK